MKPFRPPRVITGTERENAMTLICWFRRVLRLDDHPALVAAAGAGAVVPLVILDPAEARDHPASAQRQAMALAPLDRALRAQGSRLIVRRGAPDAVLEAVERKLSDLKSVQDEVKRLKSKLASGQADEIAASAADGVVVQRVDSLQPGELRDLALAVRQVSGIRVVVLGGISSSGGVSLVAAVRPETGLVAGDLIKEAAKAVGGGGGGKGDVATAGGKQPEGLDRALELAAEAARN